MSIFTSFHQLMAMKNEVQEIDDNDQTPVGLWTFSANKMYSVVEVIVITASSLSGNRSQKNTQEKFQKSERQENVLKNGIKSSLNLIHRSNQQHVMMQTKILDQIQRDREINHWA